jgi:hypothetical protein
MPGEPTMETYLGRMFNHGAIMVNIFSWGIGGEAMRDNFFRRATENPEALSAYGKFLKHATLVETAAGFSSAGFQAKMRRLQMELPDWVSKSGKQAQAMPLATKLQRLINDKEWREADKVADRLLALMNGAKPMQSKPGALTLEERLPQKIEKIQAKIPGWVDGNADRKARATALMKTLDGQLKAAKLDDAEKTADALLKMMGVEDAEPTKAKP